MTGSFMEQSTAETGPNKTPTHRVSQATETWKSKLLDLSRRNRALKFHPNRVSTIAIVDELPAAVFRQLYLLEGSLRFAPAPEVEPGTPPQVVQANGAPETDVDIGLEAVFSPYDNASLASHHTDEWLQTTRNSKDLQKSLRRIEELSRESIEEQGVNTLFLALGMLHYYESEDSDEMLRAPIVLLPVDLLRKGARDQYRVAARGEEPTLNPSLREYLSRVFGITLPSMPDADGLDEEYDLQTLFERISQAVQAQPRWALTNDIYLSLFAFQKYVMYKDLEANATALQQREVIQRLVTRSGGYVRRLPEDVESLALDEHFPPESTAQVVDADASQLRAMAAVSKGFDLVIEGPPGTGKSQTITNLIAQSLSEGKSVLFVAEKMAALNVVFNRLKAVGLSEFCLELHSTKANRRQVLNGVAQALDSSGMRPQSSPSNVESLPAVRKSLSEYVSAVHSPFGALARSPYTVFGDVERLRSAPRLSLSLEATLVTQAALADAIRRLNDLAMASTEIRPLHESPWRDSTKTYYSEQDLADVAQLAMTVREEAGRIGEVASEIVDRFGFPPIRTMAEAAAAADLAEVIGRSPGAPEAVLASTEWNSPPAAATAWVERLRTLKETTARVRAMCTEDVLGTRHADDVAFIERRHLSPLRFLAFLDRRHRSIKRRWRSYRRTGYSPSLIEQCETMRAADAVQSERALFDASSVEGRALFGQLWAGWRTDPEVLSRYVEWIVSFRAKCVHHALSERAISLASQPSPALAGVNDLTTSCERYGEGLTALRSALGWPGDYLGSDDFVTVQGRCAALVAGVGLGPRWATFESLRKAAAESIAQPAVKAVMEGTLQVGKCAEAFERAVYQKWLDELLTERPLLRQFSGIAHEQRVKEFAQLDQRVLRENRGHLAARLQELRRAKFVTQECREALPFLQREIARQRRGSSLRTIMQGAEAALKALKPCFLMSPLSVAQYLRGGDPSFDLVVFDEASQLPPEEAIGAMMRGRQVVVVGDPKQLPPTAFFQVITGQSSLTDDDLNTYTGDTESILDEVMGSGVPMSRLRWHYRSAHESLIAFSNASFYDSDLIVFPSPTHDRGRLGLSFEYVSGGLYEGKGLNLAEARHVTDAVVSFAKSELRRQAQEGRMESLGVATFNLRQQLAIQELLEARRVAEPEIEPFFDRGLPEPFFVKNLENIQGDERDHIFLSVTYGKANDGILRYNFGALNGENGQRRLNVLVTRARRRMRVFSSMRAADMNPSGLANAGPKLLKEFLRYAETGRLDGPTVNAGADVESPFELEVLAELRRLGLDAHPQIGVGKYRIDFGITDPDFPGEYFCGIECDGAAYHSSETARDRDRLRQQILEARGWTIHRIWSTDWWKDRSGQIERIQRKVSETRLLALARRTEPITAGQADPSVVEPPRESSAVVVTHEATPRVAAEYSRPVGRTYETVSSFRRTNAPILEAPEEELRSAALQVLVTEAPLHEEDLVVRVASLWDQRVGSRIRGRVLRAASALLSAGRATRVDGFYFLPGQAVSARCRGAALGIPAERIAPEEYQAAVLLVLADDVTMPRDTLVAEVRSVLGFARTGYKLEQEIAKAIDTLLVRGRVVHGAVGLRLARIE